MLLGKAAQEVVERLCEVEHQYSEYTAWLGQIMSADHSHPLSSHWLMEDLPDDNPV